MFGRSSNPAGHSPIMGPPEPPASRARGVRTWRLELAEGRAELLALVLVALDALLVLPVGDLQGRIARASSTARWARSWFWTLSVSVESFNWTFSARRLLTSFWASSSRDFGTKAQPAGRPPARAAPGRRTIRFPSPRGRGRGVMGSHRPWTFRLFLSWGRPRKADPFPEESERGEAHPGIGGHPDVPTPGHRSRLSRRRGRRST